MTASIKVQQSRFALLKVEDDEDETEVKSSTQNVNNSQQQVGTKKKNRKKKKPNQTQAENEELKNLAFGLTSAGHHSHPPSAGPVRATGHGGKGSKKNQQVTEQQWQEWKKADDQFTADIYEKDLQEALLQSKLEFEEKKKGDKEQRVGSGFTNDGVSMDGRGEGKKKKNKDKPMTMSLDQFNQMESENKPKTSMFIDDIDDIPSLLPPQPSIPKTETQSVTPGDSRFFDNVDNDVHKIIRKEKIQDEYQKQYAVESVMSSKYQQDLSKKDKEIEFLQATLKKQEEELKQVKKRNKQLCVILAQGEMKDKAEVLMQVTQLSEVRDELTEQVTELTAELEKERSKVHSMKAELDKIKGAKHAGK